MRKRGANRARCAAHCGWGVRPVVKSIKISGKRLRGFIPDSPESRNDRVGPGKVESPHQSLPFIACGDHASSRVASGDDDRPGAKLHVHQVAARQATFGGFQPGKRTLDRIDSGMSRHMDQFSIVLEVFLEHKEIRVDENHRIGEIACRLLYFVDDFFVRIC